MECSSTSAVDREILMMLKLPTIMAVDKDVLVYFEIKGREVVLKNAKEIAYAAIPSAQATISKLLDKGVPLYACPS